MFSRFFDNLANNLFTPEHPDTIGTRLYYRAFELFTIVYTMIYAWQWGSYILRISDVVLPLGLAEHINVEIFFHNNLPLINAALISICVIFAFFFDKAKWLYGIAAILLHLQYVTRYSQGEISHSSNLLGFSMLGLGIGSVFFKDKQRSLHFALGFVIFFLGLGYTSAAVSKLVATGITWPDGNHLRLWIAEKSTDVLSDTGNFNYNIFQEYALNYWYIATGFLFSGICIEITGFMMWWKRFRPFVFMLVIALHIGIYLTMNIWFRSYTIELFIIGFPWHKLIDQWLAGSGVPSVAEHRGT